MTTGTGHTYSEYAQRDHKLNWDWAMHGSRESKEPTPVNHEAFEDDCAGCAFIDMLRLSDDTLAIAIECMRQEARRHHRRWHMFEFEVCTESICVEYRTTVDGLLSRRHAADMLHATASDAADPHKGLERE